MNTANRITISLVVFLIWVSITVFGARILAGGTAELGDSVSHSIAWNILAAALFIAASIKVFGWNDMRFNAPLPGTLKVLWFPALYLLVFYAMSASLGFPPLSTLMFVFINTAIVGFSEEGMFRGVLYRALRTRQNIWPAILVSSVLFGSVHLLNAFTTGHVFQSVLQSIGATMSGFVFVAMLLRTGSIIVPMVYHALWDFGTFMLGSAASGMPATEVTSFTYFLPVLFILPNFLYALWLLKNLPKHPDAMALA